MLQKYVPTTGRNKTNSSQKPSQARGGRGNWFTDTHVICWKCNKVLNPSLIKRLWLRSVLSSLHWRLLLLLWPRPTTGWGTRRSVRWTLCRKSKLHFRRRKFNFFPFNTSEPTNQRVCRLLPSKYPRPGISSINQLKAPTCLWYLEINFKGFRLQTLLLIQHALGIAICRWVLEQNTYLRTQTNTQIKGSSYWWLSMNRDPGWGTIQSYMKRYSQNYYYEC